jgi:LmbE family N-acetylglucosaminyl deacetylase
MKLDILAIGVHPDDVELGCSGTLLNEIKLGKKAGILDLTQGELGTRGTVETRYEEAGLAARVLGVAFRENLKMRDGFFVNDETHRRLLAGTFHWLSNRRESHHTRPLLPAKDRDG